MSSWYYLTGGMTYLFAGKKQQFRVSLWLLKLIEGDRRDDMLLVKSLFLRVVQGWLLISVSGGCIPA
jgi:hypothetical protein